MERYVAIDKVCAWPNLTKLTCGEIVATIFNQPCHGKWEGDVECWASADGRYWEKRGVPAPHDPGTNRMNVAAGLAGNGDLIVIASGWDSRPPRPDPVPVFPHDIYEQPQGTQFAESRTLPAWICRSADTGKTWTRTGNITLPEGGASFIPFGDVLQGDDGVLATTCYSSGKVWFVSSDDDGQSWCANDLIAADFNETCLLHLGEGLWLAAARSAAKEGMGLFRSEDNGKTWVMDCRISLPSQHPGHLLRLDDGRILFSCGMRNPGFHGVTVRCSEDKGRNWSAPSYLVEYDAHADGGYPSCIQLRNGMIVTAYYCSNAAHHQRYHMGVVRWHPDELT